MTAPNANRFFGEASVDTYIGRSVSAPAHVVLCTTSITLTSTTWASLVGTSNPMAADSTPIANGITRSGSAFTVPYDGHYFIAVDVNVVAPAGAGNAGLRLYGGSGSNIVECWGQRFGASQNGVLTLRSVVPLSGDDNTITIQYVVSAAFSAYGTLTLDSNPTATGRVAIFGL